MSGIRPMGGRGGQGLLGHSWNTVQEGDHLPPALLVTACSQADGCQPSGANLHFNDMQTDLYILNDYIDSRHHLANFLQQHCVCRDKDQMEHICQ